MCFEDSTTKFSSSRSSSSSSSDESTDVPVTSTPSITSSISISRPSPDLIVEMPPTAEKFPKPTTLINPLPAKLNDIRQSMKEFCQEIKKFDEDNKIVYSQGDVQGFWGPSECTNNNNNPEFSKSSQTIIADIKSTPNDQQRSLQAELKSLIINRINSESSPEDLDRKRASAENLLQKSRKAMSERKLNVDNTENDQFTCRNTEMSLEMQLALSTDDNGQQ